MSQQEVLGKIFMDEVKRHNDGNGCTRRQLVDSLLVAAQQHYADLLTQSSASERCDVSVTGKHRIDDPYCKDCGQVFPSCMFATTAALLELVADVAAALPPTEATAAGVEALATARSIQLPFPCGCLDRHSAREVVVEEVTCETHRAIANSIQRLVTENELCRRAFETDDMLRIPEVGNLNALQIVKKLARLSNQVAVMTRTPVDVQERARRAAVIWFERTRIARTGSAFDEGVAHLADIIAAEFTAS